MIVLVAPEPVFWLKPILEIVSSVSDEILLVAPWAFRRKAPSWLPSSGKNFWDRRYFSNNEIRLQKNPRWIIFEGALRLWATQKTPRQMASRFFLRRKVDSLASRSLPSSTRLVIAPSCAAERTFAIASRRGIKTVLIEDLPAIRELHEDLDRAAKVHPHCAFLKRYRAPHPSILRQERERVLSNLILVRGRFARSLRESLGIPISSLHRLPSPIPLFEIRQHRERSQKAKILLAGLATARNGVMEALEILKGRPNLTLCVRKGEGMEPDDLLDHPQVQEATPEDLSLQNVDLVLAPSWCESYPPELPFAQAKGIPIVATARASGFIDLRSAGEEVSPGDVKGLGATVERLLLSRNPNSKSLQGSSDSDNLVRALRDLV